jgi:class 3 adenylate cyclase/tetratricopeptide (TPR) repeat protein
MRLTRCPYCHCENPDGARFCGDCGARLAASDIRGASSQIDSFGHVTASSESALEGENKQITVLFADMQGSLALIADRNPEEAQKLIDPILGRMMEAVQRFEGTISSLMGDGIMALFGAPFAYQDHAIRACYAALRMQEIIKRYAHEIQRTHGVPIQIRVGLNSGEALVCAIGNNARRGYTAVGFTVHLAARMEQAAMPGSILITSSTLRLVEGFVQTKELGKLHVKGLSVPVEAHEVIGAEAVRTRLQAAVTRGLTRLIGRNPEIDQLGSAWQRAATGRGQIVAIVGEPGVGKSRLIYEFMRSHSGENWLILESGPVSYTARMPVIVMLKSYFKIQDRDDHRTIRKKVAEKLLSLDEFLQASIPAILALLDTPSNDLEWEKLDPELRRAKVHDAVKWLLLRTAEVQPLLVVFEDLHGIDAETQAILNYLALSLHSSRMLLLVSYRPEYRHEWQSMPCYNQIRINPLEPEYAENLLDALLGSDATLLPLKRFLAQRTAGNPFFLEESARSLIESKSLIGDPGAYRFVGSLAEIQVPSTIQPCIAERIDRLSSVNKQLLQAAAVIGMNVPSSLLYAVVELGDEAVRHGLAQLQSAEYVYEAGIFPEPEYVFKHALTHEVAYRSLLQERRRKLHAEILQASERLYRDRIAEHVERLAHHAVRGEVWEKAELYSYQAGLKAAARSAHGEAVGRFTSALKAIEHLPQSESLMKEAFDLLFSLRTSLSPLGEYRRTFELLNEAESIARRLNDPARQARVFTFKSLCFWSIGRQDLAIDASEQAVITAQPVGEHSVQVLSKMFAGRAQHARGDYVKAIDLLNWVIRTTDGDRTNFLGMANLPSVSARAWLSWSLAERGEFELALMRSDEAVYIAEAIDQFATRIYAYMALGIVHLRKSNFDVAIQSLERAFQLSERADLRMARATVAGYLGRAYTFTNQVSRAIELLNQAVTAADGMELMVGQAMRMMHLSEAYLHDNQPEKATHMANLALQNALNYHERGAAAWIHWLLGEINAAHSDSRGAAENHYSQAAALASQLGMAPLLKHCHIGLKKASFASAEPNGGTIASQQRLHVDS